MKIPHYAQSVLARYLSPTSTLGSRIRLTHPGLGVSVTIPYNYEAGDTAQSALVWLHAHGVQPECVVRLKNDEAVLFVFPACDNTALFTLFVKEAK